MEMYFRYLWFIGATIGGVAVYFMAMRFFRPLLQNHPSRASEVQRSVVFFALLTSVSYSLLGVIQLAAGRPSFDYVYSHDWTDTAAAVGKIVVLSITAVVVTWLWRSNVARLVSELHVYYWWVPKTPRRVQVLATIILTVSVIGFLLSRPTEFRR
jgi:hypothetical protein